MNRRTKLIEVALPLPEINDASSYDKMPGIGPHPKGIHHWWARLPLPTARAVLFASVVDDPSSHPERWPTEEAQQTERERLFDIVRRMMVKNAHRHPEVYAEARAEMLRHCGGRLPTVWDPFAGGGSIPLEASRLGFSAFASDLNPIPVLLNKCNLEVLPRWTGRPPVNSHDREKIGGTDGWTGVDGLAADVKYYAKTIGERAAAKLRLLYPPVAGSTAVAWLWARTVASPNPAAQGRHVPLLSTFWLANKKGGEAWLEPRVDRTSLSYRFDVRTGMPEDRATISAGTKLGKGGFRCLLTGDPLPFSYIRSEGQQGRLGQVMVAMVADRSPGRGYLAVTPEHVDVANVHLPDGVPDTYLPEQALGFRVQAYGIRQHWQMFSARQLTAMVTFSDLIRDVVSDVRADAMRAGLASTDADEYARTVASFLALALDRCADFNNMLCRWSASNQKVMNLFGQAIVRMVWDFAEANFIGDSVGSWTTCSDYVSECIKVIPVGAPSGGRSEQIDAASAPNDMRGVLVSTDPPYYDNMGYAALSDFFYVWLRRTIGDLHPDIFSTVLVPKLPELTASPENFDGSRAKAKDHFEAGFRNAFTSLRSTMDQGFPLTVYYAFKQDDEDATPDDERTTGTVDLTTGWETLLEALIGSGFQITGTWPVRASQQWRMRAMGANALASYIVLACRERSARAAMTDRRSFISELKRELPVALRRLQQGNIAPVDFAQAAIGPGMAVYSRYSAVLDSGGRPMTVRGALAVINQTLTEVLSEQEDDFDGDSRWALAWFDQHGFAEGEYGVAETLSKAKNTSVKGMEDSGILESKRGKVRLLTPEDLPAEWAPELDRRTNIWEMLHQLIKVFEHSGEAGAARLLAKYGAKADAVRELAYRLFSACERRKRAREAGSYNSLIQSWPEIARLVKEQMTGLAQEQAPLFGEE